MYRLNLGIYGQNHEEAKEKIEKLREEINKIIFEKF